MPCWVMLLPFCRLSEARSSSVTDLLSEAPSLLCSCDGSTRASIAVLSQIEPTPGAVIAAHAAPEDRCSPVVIFCCSASEADNGLLPGDGEIGADPRIPERNHATA